MGTISFVLAFIFLIIAHLKSDFNETRQKPNSLLYIADRDTNTAVWATYDQVLDPWTKNYIQSDQNIAIDYIKNSSENKYAKKFSFVNTAPLKQIPPPIIEIKEDTIIGSSRQLHLCVAAQRIINRIDLYTETIFNFENVLVNGVSATNFEFTDGNTYNAFTKRWAKKLLTHYVTNNEPLEIEMRFHRDSLPGFIVYESSYDLLQNQYFSIPVRDKSMMSKPFLLNDAVIVKKSFTLDPLMPSRDSVIQMAKNSTLIH